MTDSPQPSPERAKKMIDIAASEARHHPMVRAKKIEEDDAKQEAFLKMWSDRRFDAERIGSASYLKQGADWAIRDAAEKLKRPSVSLVDESHAVRLDPHDGGGTNAEVRETFIHFATNQSGTAASFSSALGRTRSVKGACRVAEIPEHQGRGFVKDVMRPHFAGCGGPYFFPL